MGVGLHKTCAAGHSSPRDRSQLRKATDKSLNPHASCESTVDSVKVEAALASLAQPAQGRACGVSRGVGAGVPARPVESKFARRSGAPVRSGGQSVLFCVPARPRWPITLAFVPRPAPSFPRTPSPARLVWRRSLAPRLHQPAAVRFAYMYDTTWRSRCRRASLGGGGGA